MFQNISKHIKYHKLIQDITKDLKSNLKGFKIFQTN